MLNSRHWNQHTKIVCTLGPATSGTAVIERLIRVGMDVVRLNLSHGSLKEHGRYIQQVRDLNLRLPNRAAILLDLPGPKYRTGEMKIGSAYLKKGSQVVLTTRRISGDDKLISINLPTLPQDAKIGRTLLVDDGAIQLKVLDVHGSDVICKVIVGGPVTAGRGVVLPGIPSSAPFMTEALRDNLDFAIRHKPDYIALSFVGTAADVEQVRTILHKNGLNIPLISKIERADAVKNFDRILAVSDGIMVARGDMGVELPLKEVPLIQKEIIRKCNKAGKGVITATQMLESMVDSPRPTRAEVSDVANAILDGTDAIMLSAETSIGKYPVQAAKMMNEIALETEKHLNYELLLTQRNQWLEHKTDELISYNACYTAFWLKAAAIVAFTQTGSTARRVSKYRPRVPIIAVTPNGEIAGRLILYWGVHAFNIQNPSSVDDMFKKGAELAKRLGIAKTGDSIVITGGIPVGTTGKTNLLKVEVVK